MVDEKKFWSLVAKFEEETCLLSCGGNKVESYKLLLAMGPDIVPLLAEAIEKRFDWRLGSILTTLANDCPEFDKSKAGVVIYYINTLLDWCVVKGYLKSHTTFTRENL